MLGSCRRFGQNGEQVPCASRKGVRERDRSKEPIGLEEPQTAAGASVRGQHCLAPRWVPASAKPAQRQVRIGQ